MIYHNVSLQFDDLFTSAHANIAVFIKNVLGMQTDSYKRIILPIITKV